MRNKKIKICRLVTRLNIGGPARHVLYLTKRMNDDRYETTLVRGSEEEGEDNMDWLAEELEVPLVELSEMSRTISPLKDIFSVLKFYRILKREKPTILHTHTAKAGFVGRVAGWLARVPFIVHTHHGHYLYGYFSPLKTKVFIMIEKILNLVTDKLLTVSERVRKDIIHAGMAPADKLFTIPLGLDLKPLADLKPHAGKWRRTRGLDPDRTIIGHVARLVPIKGHSFFLEAVEHFVSHHAGALKNKPHFVLIGDGELRDDLESQAKSLGLDGFVSFLGFEQDMTSVYADLDVLALSSFNEGLPVAVIESLAAGIPIVATRVGGVPDLLEDIASAIMVPSKDPAAFSEALKEMLRNLSRYKAAAQNYRESAQKSYSVDRLVGDMDEFYQDMLRDAGDHDPVPS